MIAILVFDSVSVAVRDRMLDSGKLPHLASLVEDGRRHSLETPARDFAAGAFYTLYSGVELGDHGIFYPFQWSPGDQRVRPAGRFPAPPAVWERLAGTGRRSLVIDPYECRPPVSFDGKLISGWGFEERVVLPRWSRPRGTGRALARSMGRGPNATEIFGAPSVSRLLELRRRLVEAPARVARAATSMLERERFDLVWLTFSAAHLAGHQFWDTSQISDRVNGDRRAELERALEDVYVAVDDALGRVLAALPEDADVIACSAVGMDVNTSRADLLPGMVSAVLSGGAGPASSGAAWRLRSAIPAGFRGAVSRSLPARAALELTARIESRGIEPGLTRAFAHPADNQGYVRFNLRGREREGAVDAADADALEEEISEGLRSFRDPDGAPAVSAVERPDAYRGVHAERLPDLVVHWSQTPATRLERVDSREFGTIMRQGAGSGRSGNHTAGDAWAIVRPGSSSHRETGRRPRLADVAATAAAVCGDEADGLAGQSLLET